MGVFRVSTGLNPADPPSRLGSFRTHSDVTDSVKRRQAAWKGEPNRFTCLEFLPRFAAVCVDPRIRSYKGWQLGLHVECNACSSCACFCCCICLPCERQPV